MPIQLATFKPFRYQTPFYGFRSSLWLKKLSQQLSYSVSSRVVVVVAIISTCQVIIILTGRPVPFVITPAEYDISGTLLFGTGIVLIAIGWRSLAHSRQRHKTMSNKLTELEHFAAFGRANANLIHEIANPLTAAFLTLELIRPNKSKHIQLAYSHLEQVQRYLEAVRQDLGGGQHDTAIHIKSEVEKVISNLAHRAQVLDVRITFTVADSVVVFGDAVKFSQIISNLVANAIDAYLDIPTYTTRAVDIHVSEITGGIVCKVTDRGCGLSKIQLRAIFRPFYSTKAGRHNNLGLGLATVKQYVEVDFGGKIAVTSNRSRGTCFMVRIPNRSRD
ncbi:HAMP domain-containing histidine kinase [Polaromonas sp.]|nr:HAMP domain-containing histidine kinase [Candidatus Saccharibacteria bacterium]